MNSLQHNRFEVIADTVDKLERLIDIIEDAREENRWMNLKNIT